MQFKSFLALVLWLQATAAWGQAWQVESLPVRVAAQEQAFMMGVATSAPAQGPVRHVVVYPQPGAEAQLKVTAGSTTLSLAGPWTRAATQLNQLGVAVMYVDPPATPKKLALQHRTLADVQQIMNTAAEHARRRFPLAAVHVGGFGAAAQVLLDAAPQLPAFSRVVMVSSYLLNGRAADWSGLGPRVMLLHATASQCDSAPFHEAEYVAERNRFALVRAGYGQPETEAECGRRSQHVLAGLEDEFAQAVAGWLDGGPAPAAIGAAQPQPPWREEVTSYKVARPAGDDQLEVTLLVPTGKGPFPVLLFNHGDVGLAHSSVRYRQRSREIVVAREFVKLGMAVVMPSRRGVGLSTGTYPRGFSATDADATYKARVHAEDIMPALDWIRTRPELDPRRIVLSGQSAGGYSAMYLASANLAGVVGVINFAGGRTDLTSARARGELNTMMVEGFREFGKTMRVPALLIFADNDSRYTAQTIQASHAAFRAAGGNATLLLRSGVIGDGHHIHNSPVYWRHSVEFFLAEIGALRPLR